MRALHALTVAGRIVAIVAVTAAAAVLMLVESVSVSDLRPRRRRS